MKMMFRVAAACLLGAADQASASQIGNFLSQHLGFEQQQQGLVRALEFKHVLRVCNAYPDDTPMDVFKGSSEKLTRDSPMPFKACKDFDSAALQPGDKLDVKVGDVASGSFSLGALPDNDAIMLLVVHRHDTESSAVSFDSHIFGNLAGPQVAVIDAYKGGAKATPRVKDLPGKNHSRIEELKYNNVVGMSQGRYNVVLDDDDGNEVAKSSFVALNHQSYVVLRTGVESKAGHSFREDVVVFPQSDPSQLPHSAAAGLSAFSGLLLMPAALATGLLAGF